MNLEWILNSDFFRFDKLSIFIAIFISIFSLLTILCSFGFMRGRKGLVRYYTYIILTFISSLGAVFSNGLIIFMVFWGFLGLLLYLLINFGKKENTTYTAKKTFIIIGGSDAFMLLGLALIWYLTKTLKMDEMSISLSTTTSIWAYLCLAVGVFAKVGAMPFHTWVPDTASDAPTPVTAYLPASLDKLLGIYFLTRISLDIFHMNSAMNTLLMAVGSFTIIAAVMMALVQSNLKRMLGLLTVSSAGYMLLGLGTANPVGVAGGLFYMLNSAICMSCLFIAYGGVEHKTGNTNLERLGGFAKLMPVTFITSLIASLAISGVPPFNGFVSKWIIYQGIIEVGKNGGYLWIVWLVAAIFGSALTLASFLKLIHAVFLGQPSSKLQVTNHKLQEVGPTMWIPTIILALLCIIFGVFAYRVPLRMFIFPSLAIEAKFMGIWSPNLATILIIAGLVLGSIIYLLGTVTKTKEADIFVGGEILKEHPDMRVSGAEFYNTIQDIGILKVIYRLAQRKIFDLYEVSTKIILSFTKALRYIHNGILPTYLAWCLLGMIILFYILLR